ncbi:MAG: fibronectin type III domain-containing protein [Lachnospiraceae bacterium]|nr:fibronectin type III domain-containing protein [Lachnospiraceae bacterium]
MNIVSKMKHSVGLFVLCAAVWLSGQAVYAANTEKVSGTARYDYAYQVLNKVNAERKAAGVSELTMDEDLLSAAMLRAVETVVSFDHIRPNGTRCFTASSKMYGENIASGFGTPTEVMQAWMSSDGHKKNILNSSFQSIGVGCIVNAKTKRVYWVQCFGYEAATAVTKPANATVTYQVAKDTSSTTTLLSDKSEGEDLSSVSGLKVTAKKRKLTVKWKAKDDVTGYQVQISTSRTFKNKQSYKVKTGKTSKTITKYNSKKLKTGKKYYIRVRAYVKEGAATSYSDWRVTDKKVK